MGHLSAQEMLEHSCLHPETLPGAFSKTQALHLEWKQANKCYYIWLYSFLLSLSVYLLECGWWEKWMCFLQIRLQRTFALTLSLTF